MTDAPEHISPKLFSNGSRTKRPVAVLIVAS